jgi:hypothetical protein
MAASKLNDKSNNLTDRGWQKILAQKQSDGQPKGKRKKQGKQTADARSDKHGKNTKDLPIRAPLDSCNETKSKSMNCRPSLAKNLQENAH